MPGKFARSARRPSVSQNLRPLIPDSYHRDKIIRNRVEVILSVIGILLAILINSYL